MAMTKSPHKWQFEYLSPNSQWIFVEKTPYAESLGVYVRELGHFYQNGKCIVHRVPEDSFSISFGFRADNTITPTQIRFNNGEIYTESQDTPSCFILLIDNSVGQTTKQYGSWESYFIQFSGPLAKKYCQLLLQGNCFRLISVKNYSRFENIFKSLLTLCQQPINDWRDAYASILVIDLLRRLFARADTETIMAAQNPYVLQALELMETGFTQPLRLADIAQSLHVSPAHLSRLFHSETGGSFSECLTRIRLNHAKQMLQITDMSVEAVALACGFSNSSHFIRLFHKKESITPHAYRKMVRISSEEG